MFNYCQTKVVVIKEISKLDDDVQLDAAEEAALTAEEALLLRWLGGFALHVSMKAHIQPAQSWLAWSL